jgi:hypothetical protein
MGRLGNFITEWKARRAGRKYVSKDIQKSVRHVIGPTGYNFSNAWDAVAESSEAFVESFDPRIPPSLFVSQRDKTRLNQPIPLVERRIEAHNDDDCGLSDAEIEWGSQPPGQ